jgi:hypothetical protein
LAIFSLQASYFFNSIFSALWQNTKKALDKQNDEHDGNGCADKPHKRVGERGHLLQPGPSI